MCVSILAMYFKLVCVRPAAGQSGGESYGVMGGHDDSHGNSSQDSSLMMREVSYLQSLTPGLHSARFIHNSTPSIQACTQLVGVLCVRVRLCIVTSRYSASSLLWVHPPSISGAECTP